MTRLICSIEEYHKYIGPRIRNAIQTMTKKEKMRLSHIRQHCKQKAELEAAHIKGKSRKKNIERILSKYIIDKRNNVIQIDLKEIEDKIILAHKPIRKFFLFLCAKCHIKYDNS